MKKLSLLLRIIRTCTPTIISIMVLLVFTQQIRHNQIQLKLGEELASTNQSDEKDDSEPLTILDVDQSLIASNVQVHVNHVFYEIMNFEQDDGDDDLGNTGVISISDDYRRVLFSQVISPNAP